MEDKKIKLVQIDEYYSNHSGEYEVLNIVKKLLEKYNLNEIDIAHSTELNLKNRLVLYYIATEQYQRIHQINDLSTQISIKN